MWRYCEDRRISGRQLARVLGFGAANTVAGWRRFAPTKEYADLILAKLPGVRDYIRMHSPVNQAVYDAGVVIRNRHVTGGPSRRAVRLRAIAAAKHLYELSTRIKQLSCHAFWWMMPAEARPRSPADVRKLLDLGTAPLSYLEDVCGRIGLLVARVAVQSGDSPVMTRVDVLLHCYGEQSAPTAVKVPIVVILGSYVCAREERYCLARELGFLCCCGDEKSSARLAAVERWADELLVPLEGLRVWLPPYLKRLSNNELTATAVRFGVPVDVVKRQVLLLGITVGDAQTVVPACYLGMLASNLGMRPEAEVWSSLQPGVTPVTPV